MGAVRLFRRARVGGSAGEQVFSAIFVALALVAFVVAAIIALAVNIPRRFQATTPEGLNAVLREKWSDSDYVAARRVTATRVRVYASYRRANRSKAKLLVAAVVAEVIAVAFVAVAVLGVLWDAT